MPELPEVQTTVNGINRSLRGLRITDVWTDYGSPLYENHKQIKSGKFFKKFKKDVVGVKILKAERRAKNVLIHLSNPPSSSSRVTSARQGGNTILVHLKMTGHLLYGEYVKRKTQNVKRDNKKLNASRSTLHEYWSAVERGPLRDDPYNQYIHLVFTLSNGRHLVLSDVRKFAKVTILPTEKLAEEFKQIGPEPLEKSFQLSAFSLQLNKRPKGKIKPVLMDQSVVAGIGNIYSDEILWASSVHPLRSVKSLNARDLKNIFVNIKLILKKGTEFGGDSLQDYRRLDGERGKFQHKHRAYQRTGLPCLKKNCRGTIRRIAIGGRSAHFCDKHQR